MMERKRILSLLCVFALVLSLLPLGGVSAAASVWAPAPARSGGDWDLAAVETVAAQTAEDLEKKLSCSSAILIEQSTGKVLYEKNADTPMPPASITKIMTMLLLMERLESGELSLADKVVAQPHACSMGGSQIWLEPGEEMTIDELLRATAIQSANDAAVALAEYMGGSEEGFVVMMNEKAAQLGMTGTTFCNASGLDEEGHLTTARDIAIMSQALLQYPKIVEYSTIWMSSLRNGETQLTNTNKLIHSYPGITGLKTGTTNGAGSCLSASAERDGMGLVAVVMGCQTSDQRFSSAKALLNHGFAHWKRVTPESIQDQLQPVPVKDGVQPLVAIREGDLPSVILPQNSSAIESRILPAESLQAPVQPGDPAGTVEVYWKGELVASYPLVADAAVEELTFSRALGMLFSGLLCTK